MRQFKDAKERYPDCIIFFRMGDFYELFYNDAVIASRELSITLTKRGSIAQIPLAGIPYHAIDTYLPRLVNKGYKVAICEQIEDPKKAKGLVKRDIVKVVSPGTLMSDNQLFENSNNFLMAIYKDKNYGISICDLSTGELKTTLVNKENLLSEIIKYSPSEIILPQSLEHEINAETFINKPGDNLFKYKNAYEILTRHFDVLSLNGFGIEDLDECIQSSGALIKYLHDTQMTDLTHINSIQYYSSNDFMVLDKATIVNLELVNSIKDNSKKGTLLETIDKTSTSMGARLMRQWILRPLLSENKIIERLNAVETFITTPFLKEELVDLLKQIGDIERLISKVNYKSANARDLLSLKNSLTQIPLIKNELSSVEISQFNSAFNNGLEELTGLINASINDEPPTSIREGGIIKQGFNEELDKLHDICNNGKKYILELENKEKERTNIPSLKIGFNRVFGYFIEITNKHSDKIPSDYIRKQTRVNSERYVNEELKELESSILNAQEKIHSLEYDIFMQIIEKVNSKTSDIQVIAKDISILDCLLSFAYVSSENNYCKPAINNEYDLKIIDGRHPTIERFSTFVPNNCDFDNGTKMKIITGPNMAGKSTYMRQCALIVLLAQIGCFVPAKSANIGVCDRIFTRIGAHDDLTSGQSTFMVEMSETANILNNATIKSLIVLDEIGRGTSTFDGVSIAWSVAEYINNRIGAKTLFATHYHVLTKLAKEDGVKNYSIAVKEKNDEIIFLRKIVENATNKSFGIQVAKLSGVPAEVINRAKQIMSELENQDKMVKAVKTIESHEQMNLLDL